MAGRGPSSSSSRRWHSCPTQPRPGDARSPAFHVVVPSSLPGYGFSGKPTTRWDVPRIARAWVEVMRTPRLRPLYRRRQRLGHERVDQYRLAAARAAARHSPYPAARSRRPAEVGAHRPRAGGTDGARGAVAYRVGLFGGASDAPADHRLFARRLTRRVVRLDSGEGLDLVRPRPAICTACSLATKSSTTSHFIG